MQVSLLTAISNIVTEPIHKLSEHYLATTA
jgi:hypothetical protein